MKKAALMAALLSALLLCLHVGLVAAQTESEPLVAGCNPVTSTYADATPIATIAGAVTPAEALQGIWQLDVAAGAWLGYSPQFPAASDLTQVDRLDVVFICVNAAGSFDRPVI
jgi:hypothetical protein